MGSAQVAQSEMALLVHKNVLWFEVQVGHLAVVEALHQPAELLEEGCSLTDRKETVFSGFEKVKQVA